MGERRVRGLKAKVGQECCISRGSGKWARWNGGSIQAGGIQRGNTMLVGVEPP